MEKLEGTWTNRSGSILQLEEHRPGELSGAIITAKGRGIDRGIAYPVVGHASTERRGMRRVSLSVLWAREEQPGAGVTAFAGRADLQATPPRLELHWVLSWHPDNPEDEWTSLHLGRDEFVLGPPASAER